MTLHTAFINHEYGGTHFVAYSEEGIYHKLFDFVNEWWHQIDVDEDIHNLSPRDAIDIYFKSRDDEWYHLDVATLEGAQ